MSEEGYSTFGVRIRAVQAVERGWATGAAADAFGIAPRTLHRWLRRYERDGEDGLEPRPGSGRPRVLEELGEEELRAIVLRPASTVGYETDLWTVGRLHQVIQEQYRVAVSRDTIWRRLREAGLTYQKPEREYYELDEAARQQWQRYEVPRIRRCVEKYRASLYFQDESNVSLTAFLGKMWHGSSAGRPISNIGLPGCALTSADGRRVRCLSRLNVLAFNVAPSDNRSMARPLRRISILLVLSVMVIGLLVGINTLRAKRADASRDAFQGMIQYVAEHGDPHTCPARMLDYFGLPFEPIGFKTYVAQSKQDSKRARGFTVRKREGATDVLLTLTQATHEDTFLVAVDGELIKAVRIDSKPRSMTEDAEAKLADERAFWKFAWEQMQAKRAATDEPCLPAMFTEHLRWT